jgi:hypothetical protein
MGGLAGGIGPPLAGALGGGATGAIGSGAILGAAFGGIGAAAAGKNVLAGMLGGAVSGALLAAAIYGGCKAFEGSSSPALAGDADTTVRIGSRPLDGSPFGEHKFIQFEDERIFEMGPEGGHLGGKIHLYDSAGEFSNKGGTDITAGTAEALRNPDSVHWTETRINMSRFTEALTAYKAEYIGVRTYNPLSHNSNFFVNSVISAAGGNPTIPGAVAPACVPFCPFGAWR